MKYIEDLNNGLPKFFNDIKNRCSQTVIKIEVIKKSQYNNACLLSDLASKACSSNSERHVLVENFMLINDSSTIACEVPVWFWEKNLNIGISGHIDILQIRHNKIFILDYKPEAFKVNMHKVASQLFWYALGLSFRTSIPLSNFVCAWFDDCIYCEFSPLLKDVDI